MQNIMCLVSVSYRRDLTGRKMVSSSSSCCSLERFVEEFVRGRGRVDFWRLEGRGQEGGKRMSLEE